MKTKFYYLSTIALMALAFSFFMVSCEKDSLDVGIVEGSGEFAAFVETECDEPCYEWVCETAWAANDCSSKVDDATGSIRYVNRGNWATYVEMNRNNEGLLVYKDVSLFAGQTIEVGAVLFYPAADNKVRIEIFIEKEGWEFCPVDENVKIDGFNSLSEAQINRTGNPVPGQFPYKETASGIRATIIVDEFDFYGVHVEVGYEKVVECPVPVD